MTLMTQLTHVLGLQGAVLASEFSGAICFSPTVTDPAAFYDYSTLSQLAAGITAVNERAGSALRSHVLKAGKAVKKKDEEAFRVAWTQFQALLEGRNYRSKEALQDPITDFEAKLVNVDARQGRVMSGLADLRITKHITSFVVKSLRRRQPTTLAIRAGKGKRFCADLLDKGNAGTELIITLPPSQKILTARQLNILAARAALAAELAPMISPESKKLLTNVIPPKLSQAVPLYDIESVLGLRDALAQSRFKEYLGTVSLDRGIDSIFRPSTLMGIAKAIGASEPSVGSRLYVVAARADAAERGYGLGRNQTTTFAWKKFADILKEPGQPAADPLVEMDVLERVVSGLDFESRNRRSRMEAELVKIGIQDPDVVLDSLVIDFDERWGIYPTLRRGTKENFHISVRTQTRRYIDVDVVVPETQGPLSENQLRLLIARALLFSVADKMMPQSELRKVSAVVPRDLARPVPLVLVKDGDVLQLDSYPLTKALRKRLSNFQDWVALWSASLLDAYYDGEDRRPPHVEGLTLTRSMAIERDRISSLMRVPNVSQVVLKELSPLRGMSCSFMFKMVPEDGGESIGISTEDTPDKHIVKVEIAPSTLKRLTTKDLLDMFFRASLEKRLAKLHTKDVTLRGLRKGEGLSSEMLLQRSALMLILAYRGFAGKGPAEVSIDGSGEFAVAGSMLARSLTAIGRFAAMTQWETHRAAWQDIMNLRRWYIHSTGLEHNDLVGVIPVGNTVIVHVHGVANALTSLDWLYILSVMAANPLRAIKLHLDNRDVPVGQRGDANELYSGIAANRMFEPFGVFDPTAKPPADMTVGFPGGIHPRENPHLKGASVEKSQRYIRALRWFTTAAIPREWKPLASDTKDEVKKRRWAMNLAWHPDRQPGREEANLLAISNEYWDAVLNIYP